MKLSETVFKFAFFGTRIGLFSLRTSQHPIRKFPVNSLFRASAPRAYVVDKPNQQTFFHDVTPPNE